VKLARQHADHGVRRVIKNQRLPHDIPLPPKRLCQAP
jgi:hypothetical protein